MTLGFVFPYGLLKLQARKQLEHLRKNAAYSIQGGFLLRLRLFWSKLNLRQRGSAFIHFSNANLDKPVACYVSETRSSAAHTFFCFQHPGIALVADRLVAGLLRCCDVAELLRTCSRVFQ